MDSPDRRVGCKRVADLGVGEDEATGVRCVGWTWMMGPEKGWQGGGGGRVVRDDVVGRPVRKARGKRESRRPKQTSRRQRDGIATVAQRRQQRRIIEN